MTAKRFCILTLSISAAVTLIMSTVNFMIDQYGLFHDTKGKSISIYSDERTAKYLLAHNYVPENFEAYILGPSLSANINPKEISEVKIYNLSMMGANITEQKAVVMKALEKSTPKFVVLCLHPYLTMDHGMKTGMINPNEYYGALGSISLYKSYATRIIRQYDLLPSKFPKDQFNDFGCNDYRTILQKMPVEDKINEQLQRADAIKTDIDSVAWVEFNELVNILHNKNIKIVAYFHPLPYPLYNKFRQPLELYKQKVYSALNEKALIIDFNQPRYEDFSKDLSNYIDHGHFSEKGQSYILREILKKGGLSK